MTINGIAQLAIYMVVLLALVKPLGSYMAAVYEGTSRVTRVLAPVERWIYRLLGTREDEEMGWKTYALAFLLFNGLGLLVVYSAAAHPGRWSPSARQRSTWRRP